MLQIYSSGPIWCDSLTLGIQVFGFGFWTTHTGDWSIWFFILGFILISDDTCKKLGVRIQGKDFEYLYVWFLVFGLLVLKRYKGSFLLLNWLRRNVFITYLMMKWSFTGLCFIIPFSVGGNLFVRSGDYELTNTWRSYVIVLSVYCQEVAISLYVKYTFEVNFSTRYKAQVWVVLLQHQVGYI